MYSEEDWLQLAGLQHFVFCRRQWALIHLEQQWEENPRTIDGEFFHERAHDEQFKERRGDLFTVRGLRIFSRELGVSGQCDVVEFRRSDEGIPLNGHDGKWKPYPVEYKRGKKKTDLSDQLQLCAQAICLEEMLCCSIMEGALFYGEERKREKILLTDDLREQVRTTAEQMHDLYSKRYTPRVKTSKKCGACSLREICLPQIMKCETVSEYIHRHGRELE